MKTIKIIDLLNKIAIGEEVPETIRIGALDMYWDGDAYWDEDGESQFCEVIGSCEYGLNREVEIIEEEIEEKEIEKIRNINVDMDGTEIERIPNNDELKNKINEIIDAVNELKREGK